ncbi:MAG: hypothetical protein P8X74_00125 [Reinekea sp.]|jgi:hypothetical protein
MRMLKLVLGLLLATFCVVGNATAENYFVGQVQSINYSKHALVVGDSLVTYNNLVKVARSDSSGQITSASINSIKIGDWVSVDLEIDHSVNMRQANAIYILENYSQRESYYQSQTD